MNENNYKIIESYLFKYLELKNIKFNEKKNFQCPFHKDHPDTSELTASVFPPNSYHIHCNHPKHGDLGTIISLARRMEDGFKELSDDDIAEYLVHLLDIQLDSKVEKILQLYKEAGFCLFPLKKQNQGKESKEPIQKEFQKSENRNLNEWKEWLKANCGVALNLGPKSNVIAIDIDSPETYEKVKHLLGDTLTQSTKRGNHYLYNYDKDFDKVNHANLRNKGYEMEVRANNAYIVVAPTSVEGEVRDWNYHKIIDMPKELKKFLLGLIDKQPEKDELKESIKVDDLGTAKLKGLDGCRNDTFVKLGGILRKKLNMEGVSYALTIFNKLLEVQVPQKELTAMLRQIDKYTSFDKEEMSRQIMKHLDLVETATSRDLKDSLRFEKKDIEECLFYLLEEKKVYKIRNTYKLLKKANWKETFIEDSKLLDFKVPYFEDYATFRQGDMIIIEAPPGVGKTTIAVNILSKLIKQKIKPCYVSSEPGNRFTTMALTLEICEGQFKWVTHYRPETIELDDNAVTIIDWLLPEDYSQVDKLYQKFSEQLDKHKGLLIVFTQAKKEGTSFSGNMIDMFASLFATYKHINGDNLNTCFETKKIRESKTGKQKIIIPTVYDYKTKRLELR